MCTTFLLLSNILVHLLSFDFISLSLSFFLLLLLSIFLIGKLYGSLYSYDNNCTGGETVYYFFYAPSYTKDSIKKSECFT